MNSLQHPFGRWGELCGEAPPKLLHTHNRLPAGVQREEEAAEGLRKQQRGISAGLLSDPKRSCEENNLHPSQKRTPDTPSATPRSSHLVRVHVLVMGEVEEGDEHPDALALQPVPEEVTGHHPSHKVLACARPAVEGED